MDAAFRGQGQGDFLLFSQFGHGAEGPELLLGDGAMRGHEFVRLFADHIDPHDPPYTAILMGGCFSGGFASSFLAPASPYLPDFFYATSAPFAESRIGLRQFFAAPAKMTDLNHDGIATLRERAIYDMNTVSDAGWKGYESCYCVWGDCYDCQTVITESYYNAVPWGVMFSRFRSKDVDLDGQPALKPYFSKSVERIATHEELMAAIDALRFGEQAVVLIDGHGQKADATRAWFENEATQGDGYYRHLIIADNPESREYFNLDGGSAIIAMGLNLRRRGVRLDQSSPIGEQLPRILAQEDALIVMQEWKDKVRQKPDNHLYNELIKKLEERHNRNAGSFAHAFALIGDLDASGTMKGFEDLKRIQDAGLDPRQQDELAEAIHRVLVVPIVERESAPARQTFIDLILCLERTRSPQARKDVSELLTLGIALYPGMADDLAEAYLRDMEDNGGMRPFEALKEIARMGELLAHEHIEGILSLSSSNDSAARRAAALFASLRRWEEDEEGCRNIIGWFQRETDDEARALLIRALSGAIDPDGVLGQEIRTLAHDAMTPAQTKEAAQWFVDSHTLHPALASIRDAGI